MLGDNLDPAGAEGGGGGGMNCDSNGEIRSTKQTEL